MKVLVIGDVMLDKFTECEPIRMSEEAPVLIVKENNSNYFLGGASNVAVGLSKLGIDVTLQGCVGDDEAGKKIMELIKENSINARLRYTSTPTTVKHRILANGRQLIRIDTERREIAEVIVLKEKWDCIIVSDYDKGVVSEKVMEQVLSQKTTVIVNGKPKNISLYESVDILTFNKKEYEECLDSGTTTGEHLCGRHNIKTLIVTLGKEGICAYTEKKKICIPGITVPVEDITGAGDTVVATLAWAMNRYNNIKKAIELANRAGSIVVQKAKTSFVTLEELGEK